MMILLQAMQGLGNPGVNLWDGSGGSPTNHAATSLPTTEDIGAPNIVCKNKAVNSVKQMIWRTQFADAVLNPPTTWYGLGLFYSRFSVFPNFVPANTDPYEANFHLPWTYPQTGESQIHAIYKEGTSFLQSWVGTSKYIQAWQSPQMEFITMVDFWWGGDARFSDILLPGTTSFERNDISGWLPTGGQYSWSVYCPQCIQPLGEAMGDLEIEIALADKLGVKSQYTENFQTEDDWIQAFWNLLSVNTYMTYEEWKQKGYFIFPFPPNYQPAFPFRAWAAATNIGPGSTQIPPFMVLETPTNKIEFDAQRLESWWPTDTQRPPVPHYIVPPEVSDPTLTSKYSLIAMAPHDRWRMHTMYDEVSWLREIPTHKLLGSDGYCYERLWMNPADAAKRGINDGDIVKAYNDRATVLFAAYVNDRMVPGYVRATQDSRYDPLDPASSLYTDKGGAMNLLTSDAPLSQHASGMAPNDFRVEVAKWEGK